MLRSLLFPDGVSRAFIRRALPIPLVRHFWTKCGWGSVETRAHFGISARPSYLYGIFHAARMARRLEIPSISIVEFGVAAGYGLFLMESIASEVSARLDVGISVYGFDSGVGLPRPQDYRDLPYIWERGNYRMDELAIRAKLKTAELIIGDVAETVPEFLGRLHAPLGFIAFDLDYYSSTASALGVFNGPQSSRLPRVYCYFDDTIRPDIACYNEFTGELLAIREFNCRHEIKLCQLHEVSKALGYDADWHREYYVLHDFRHPLYCVNVAADSDRRLME